MAWWMRIRQLNDVTVLILCMALLAISVAGVFMYDRMNQKERLNERVFYYEKAQEKAYASLFLYTEQLKAFHRELLIDEETTNWLSRPKPLVEEMYNLSLIQASFIELLNSHSGIESVYLHNRSNDIVISTHFMLATLPQFPHRPVFERYDYSNEGPVWQWVRLPADNPNHTGIVSMVGSIPSKNKLGAVAINLNERYLAESLLEGHHRSLWLDAQGAVLLSTNASAEQFYREHAEELIQVKETSFFFKDRLVIISDSAVGGWKLATIIPASELAADRSVHWSYYGVLAIFTTLGLLLLFYFRYIRREQEKRRSDELNHNLESYRKGFVVDLLSGKPMPADLEASSRQLQIQLRGSGYQVIVFHIDNYYNYLLQRGNQERFFMSKIIFNAIKWSFALKFNAHVTNTELEKVAVLLVYDAYDEDERARVEERIRYIQEDIRLNCGLTVCVGVSEVVSELSQVHTCYAHAMQAVDYKSIHGKNALIYYEKLSFSDASALPRLSREIRKIHDFLHSGDVDRIDACLRSVFKELIEQQPVTQDWVHAVFANVLSVIMKYVVEHRIDLQQHSKEDVFLTLYSYEFLEDKQAYILSLCAKIVEAMHSPKEETQSTAHQIIDYIDKHYDQPISLSILADKLAMSPSYLSVLIKSHLGIGFVDYISKLRIQKALKLLENDAMTIQEIAERCGYDTVHTFIRHFKKAHRIPPNEYRNRNRVISE